LKFPPEKDSQVRYKYTNQHDHKKQAAQLVFNIAGPEKYKYVSTNKQYGQIDEVCNFEAQGGDLAFEIDHEWFYHNKCEQVDC